MFYLRKITGDGVEMNFLLGKSYTLITQDRNKKEFEELREKLKYEVGETYGFISGEFLTEWQHNTLALFPKQQNYVMVAGKTIDHIRYYPPTVPVKGF